LNAADLRRQAEALARARRDSLGETPGAGELRRLQQELEVHQIELEIQNEELRDARAVTEAALEKYTDLYDFAPTAYFTLAADGKILAANLTGARLAGCERVRLLGRRFTQFLASEGRTDFGVFLQRVFSVKERMFFEVAWPQEGETPLAVRIEAVVSEDGRECRAVVLDVTERQRAAVERERLIEELQRASTEIKVLSGLLPICSHCKNIRDDAGKWTKIETYVTEHSEANFTHSLCPECLPKYFPGIYLSKRVSS
jgi:PAS domain S-box-containing protein